MRKPPQLVIWIFIIIGCSAESSRIPTVDEILQTEQYIFVAQQKEDLYVEHRVPEGRCPKFMTQIAPNDEKPDTYQGVHLLKEPTQSFPTRLMIVYMERLVIRAAVYQINASEIFEDPLQWQMHFLGKSNRISRINLFVQEKELINTMYDSTRRLLYLDFSTPELEHIEELYISDPYSQHRGVLRLDTYWNETTNRRFGWIEEPYSEMFYYQEQLPDGVSLFKAPINSFWRIIKRMEDGTFVKQLSDNELMKGVVGEAIYTIQKNTETPPIHTYLTSETYATGIVCEVQSPSQKLPKHLGVLVIRNDDYCHIRDGPGFDKVRCAEKQNEYMLSKKTEIDIDEEVDVIKWLLIACIFMFSLVVLMCIYVFWLRNSFVVEEEKSHEYDTEASLFVSKQRSFPSVYHDPALMDVSVDKWN